MMLRMSFPSFITLNPTEFKECIASLFLVKVKHSMSPIPPTKNEFSSTLHIAYILSPVVLTEHIFLYPFSQLYAVSLPFIDASISFLPS